MELRDLEVQKPNQQSSGAFEAPSFWGLFLPGVKEGETQAPNDGNGLVSTPASEMSPIVLGLELKSWVSVSFPKPGHAGFLPKAEPGGASQ